MNLLKTLKKIGLNNLFKNLIYKLEKKIPFSNLRKISSQLDSKDFFKTQVFQNHKLPLINKKFYFGWLSEDLDKIPDWHRSCLSNELYESPKKNWYQIPLHKESIDIKEIWEPSRMDWVVNLSFNSLNGDLSAIKTLNLLIKDWTLKNPPYKGTNWVCAQEASIRILNLSTAAIMLNQFGSRNSSIETFLKCHLKRILPSLNYSSSQQNNHITSEAAALYIGGLWLKKLGNNSGQKFYSVGKKVLEKKVVILVSEEGCFSQYSLNYQRLFVDTCTLVEIWRKNSNAEKFTEEFYEKIKKSISWLLDIIDPISGDGPNLGANDGAKLFSLGNNYRDFKNSIQLSSLVFNNVKIYEDPSADLYTKMLNIEQPRSIKKVSKKIFKDLGGFIVSQINDSKLIFRYPKFNFRPSQSDIFHIDLWIKNKNILLDRGTFSYVPSLEKGKFSTVKGHNTVQIGEKDQMEKFGRYLYLDWPDVQKEKKIIDEASSSLFLDYSFLYRKGESHRRKINFSENKLIVQDSIENTSDIATLRWNFPFGLKIVSENTFMNDLEDFFISIEGHEDEIKISNSYNSRFYLKKNKIFTLEVKFRKLNILTSKFEWK